MANGDEGPEGPGAHTFACDDAGENSGQLDSTHHGPIAGDSSQEGATKAPRPARRFNCVVCGMEFESRAIRRAMYCSRKCADKARWKRESGRNKETRHVACQNCGEPMPGARPNKKFCSALCKSRAKGKPAASMVEAAPTKPAGSTVEADAVNLARILGPCIHGPDFVDEFATISTTRGLKSKLFAMLNAEIAADPTIPSAGIGRLALLILATDDPELLQSRRTWRQTFEDRAKISEPGALLI